MPIILVGSYFWKPFDELFKKELLGRNTVDAEDLELYKILDDEDEIVNLIKNTPVRNGIKFEHNNHNHTENPTN